jgi:hypothetical protein
MIYVFGLADGLQSFRNYLALHRDPRAGVPIYTNITVIPYRDILSRDRARFNDGTYIFTDIPCLRGGQIEKLHFVIRRIQGSALKARILNQPLTYKSRYELLRFLHDRAINDHNVYRVSEHRRPSRWPVFVRHELGHWCSPLIQDQRELEQFMGTMTARGIWSGDKIVVEFTDYRSSDGLYRKYGAFRIGSRVVCDHICIGPNWYLRDFEDMPDMQTDPVLIAEELEYVRSNRCATEALEIFEIAGIQYGRLDFGIVDGRLQVWEINSAPELLKLRYFREDLRLKRPQACLLSERLYEAFAALDAAGPD